MPYEATPLPIANLALVLADAKPGEKFVDLGCGDGRLVRLAGERYRCQAYGCELDPDLFEQSQKSVGEYGIVEQVDLLTVDLMTVDVLYLNLGPANELALPQIKRMKKGSRVVSPGKLSIPFFRQWSLAEYTSPPKEATRHYRLYLYNVTY